MDNANWLLREGKSNLLGVKIWPIVGAVADAILLLVAGCSGTLFDRPYSYYIFGAMFGIMGLCILASVCCYFFGMVFIGLGQIAENTAPRVNHQPYPKKAAVKADKKEPVEADTTKEKPAEKAPVSTENSYEEEFWLCGKCKTKNLNSREDCWSCGNKK